MSGQRNWNDMSSDEDNDSWFDSTEDNTEKKEEVAGTVKDQPQGQTQPPAQNTTTEPNVSCSQQKQAKQGQSERPKRQGQGERKPFLKDEQLLVQYTNKTVDDPRVIKAVKVNNEEHKNMLKALKNARVRQVREGIFILGFETPEGVLEFIKDKIANRYRFFLQPFFKRKEEEGKEQRKGQRNGGRRDRENEGRRGDRDRDRQRKPRYQDQKEEQGRGRKQREQPKQSRREKQQEKAKKVFVAKECYQIQNNKNILTIKSEGFDVDKVIEQLQEKKVFKNFNKLRITTKFAFIAKVSKLITLIGSKHKFYLDKEPPAETKKEDDIELTLIENLPPKAGKALADKYQEEKPATKPKETRPQPPPAAKSEPVAVNSRKLDGQFDGYFVDISKCNLSEIVKGFDENQYVKRLKENSTTIFEKNWNSWKIEAEDEAIEALLKLTHRLKKSTLYDVDLKPSMRNQKPILTAELKPRPEKDRRPKVDVSGVNGYLS